MTIFFSLLQKFSYENFLEITTYFALVFSNYWIDGIQLPKIMSELAGTNELELVLYNISYYWILSLILSNISWKMYCNLFPKFDCFIRSYLVEKVYRKFEAEYSDIDLSTFINKFLTTPGNLRNITNEIVRGIIPNIFIAIMTLYTIYGIQPIISINVSIFMVFGVLIMFSKVKNCYRVSNLSHQTFLDVSKIFHDKLSNLYQVYAAGLTNYEIQDGHRLNNLILQNQISSFMCQSNIRDCSVITGIIIFVYVIYTSLQLYKDKHLDKEKCTQLFLTISSFLGKYLWLMASSGYTIDSLALLDDNEKFLDSFSSQQDNLRVRDFIPGSGKIKLTNVSFKYPNGALIYNKLNCIINPGDKIRIVGASGSGKSTLIKLILGFYKLETGKIEIDEQDINQVKLDSLRRNITYISQNNKLFDETIYYNINYGNNKSKTEIDDLITRFEVTNVYPDLLKKVGINGDQLSGGQKQIIHLLRGIFSQNKIIILDEPTLAIDNEHKKIIKNIIREIIKTKTLILITHDKDIFDLAKKKIDLIKK